MISFGDFRLDRRTRRLRYCGSERPLRAKSSAVLLHLAEHPDRLVTHGELLRAIWPGTSVSQTVLRVCIREIRAALGEEADRFLTTVPRRGYRFSVEPGERGVAEPIFVGRDAERAILHAALDRASSGHRQLVFVSGAAGTGKTALLDRFLEEIRADGGVRGARGQALDLQAGTEGCAAVLDLLSRLCDEAGGDEVVHALARRAPGWLLQLPGRVDDDTADVLRARASRSSWEGRLLEIGEALESLASERPLVLVLDDLHWSDASTLDALTYLTRRTVTAKLLVIGSYRPDSLADGHAFLETRRRLRAAGPCTEIELGALSLEEVAAYVGRRLAPHPLGDGVARALHDASAGQALRLEAAVEHLLERRRLAVRDGAWRIEGALAGTIPDTVDRRLAPRPAPGVAAEPSLAAERRQLTVMSCELVGATDLAGRLDLEDLRTVVRAYQETASAVVQRYGGHVAQYRIDGLLAYFCYPQAHEDDAERAVRAGLEVLTALATLNDTLAPEYRVRLATRIGIHTGPVVIGEMGSGAGSGMIALGDVPHMAARAQSAATPDSVLITPATQSLVAGRFVTESHGTRALEDTREPATLHRVVRPSGVRGRLAAAAGRLTPLVGRQAELAALLDRWERAREGARQTVLVRGEAGIGKSRLTLQLRELLGSTPHAWLESGATPYTAGTPFHPVIALLAQGLGFAPEDTAAARLVKIEHGLGRLATPEAAALVGDLFGLPAASRAPMSPELQRRKTIELLLAWALAIAAAQPTVLLIEDLHWCDPSSLELLGRLVSRCETASLLVLLSARPEFSSPWASSASTTTLELARLDERASRDMVELIAETMPASTVDAVVARSDGVPLFVEELTKGVVEAGRERSPDAIPATLADSLMGRLDRLSAAKEVAQRAAVLGREFTYSLLAEISHLGAQDLRRELGRLVDAEILFARGEPPEASYAFKHALLQEAAYDSLLKRTRRALHGEVFDALLRSFPERVTAEPEVPALHAERAGRIGEAIVFYRRAGERERERLALEEAIRALRRALELLATQPDDAERDAREAEIQLALGGSLANARGLSHAEPWSAYERAAALCERRGDERGLCLASIGLSILSFARGDVEHGRALAAGVLATAERMGDDDLALLAHIQVAIPEQFQGKLVSAFGHLEAARALYRPERHHAVVSIMATDPGVSTLAFMGAILTGRGWPDQGLARAREGVALARRLGHPSSLAQALVFETAIYWARREPGAQRERAAETIALAEAQGLPYFVGLGKTFHAGARVATGEVAAVADVLAGIELAAAAGNLGGAPISFVVLAEAHLAAGQIGEACAVVEMGLDLSAQTGQPFWDAELHRLRGEIWLLGSGDGDGGHERIDREKEAEKCFRTALAIAIAQETKQTELLVVTSLARLCQRRGKRAAGRRWLAPVLAWFTEGFDTGDHVGARSLLAELR